MIDLYLMLKKDLNVKQLQTIIKNNFKQIQSDIWTEINIMELDIGKNTIDFINIDNCEIDDEDKLYFKENNFESVYCISYEKEDEQTLINILKAIFNEYDGIIGSDTDNFEPIFDKDTLNKLIEFKN